MCVVVGSEYIFHYPHGLQQHGYIGMTGVYYIAKMFAMTIILVVYKLVTMQDDDLKSYICYMMEDQKNSPTHAYL